MRNICLFLLVFAGTMLLASFFAAELLRFEAALPGVAKGVSFAAYVGASKLKELKAFWLTLFLVAVLGVVLGLAAFRSRRIEPSSPSSREPVAFSSSVMLVLLFVVYALLVVPDTNNTLTSAKAIVHPFHYDAQNLISWQYFRFQGRVPWLDFWYPYGNMFYLAPGPELPSFWALLLRYVHQLFTFVVLLCGFRELTRRADLWCMLILASIYFLPLAGFGADLERYLPALAIVVLFECLWERFSLPNRALFVCYASWAILLDPIYLIYGFIPSFVAGAAHRYQESRGPFGDEKSRRIFPFALTPLIAFFAYGLWLIRVGAWAGFQRFILSLGDTANYGMYPPELARWLDAPNSLPSALLWGIFALCFIVAAEIGSTFRTEKKLPTLGIGLAALSLILFQKQLIRPHMAYQLTFLPACALMWSAFHCYRTSGNKYVRHAVLVLVTSAMVCLCLASFRAGLENRSRSLMKKLSSAPAELVTFFAPKKNWQEAEGDYFRLDSFRIGDGKMSGIEFRTEAALRLELAKDDAVFVLGDESYIYIVLKKETPYFITLYNQSLLEDQEQTIAWLQKRKPKYVFFNPQKTSFDSVPNVVRVPLLYQFVSQHYVLHTRIGPFDVLRERTGVEEPDADYWSEALGESIDLGFVPAASKLASIATSAGGEGGPVLRVLVSEPKGGRRRKIKFSPLISPKGRELDFSVEFHEDGGLHEYYIRLDRLWFWPFVTAKKAAPECRSEGIRCAPQFALGLEEILY